jgi:hypothetical protein
MWREAALNKLNSQQSTINFKTQREINDQQDQNIKRIESSWNELNDINQRFFEVSYEVNKIKA